MSDPRRKAMEALERILELSGEESDKAEVHIRGGRRTMKHGARMRCADRVYSEAAEALAALREEGEQGREVAWSDLARLHRFGRTLTEDAVDTLEPGTLLRFYSPDPWFDASGDDMPDEGDIVVFTGKVSRQFPKVGPHLEVARLTGKVYPGGGWVHHLFQFVADPALSPKEQGRVPEGWVMVPREPTEAMIEAGWIDKEDVDPDDIWAAMIAASPAVLGGNDD